MKDPTPFSPRTLRMDMIPGSRHDKQLRRWFYRPDGQRVGSMHIVRLALQTLINLEHRGAVGGDTEYGGRRRPRRKFRMRWWPYGRSGLSLPEPGVYAVGMLFLPVRKALADKCMKTVENIVEQEACEMLGWRVCRPVICHLGDLAKSSQPLVRQFFIAPAGWPCAILSASSMSSGARLKEVASWETKEGDGCSIFAVCRAGSLSTRGC